MAPSRSHGPSSHGRLHKRGHSATSITSPSALSPLSDLQAFSFNRSETPKTTYEEPWNEHSRQMPSVTSTKPLKIKPLLRKLSSKDSNALDLSRPAAENESLQGLGITETWRSASDVHFTGTSRVRHNRTTSNNSQWSTTSSLQRPTAPYMPSIRQTPQPYTPPISRSTPPSVLGSEADVDAIMNDDEFRLRQHAFDPARRSGSLSSAPGVAPIHTTGSFTRLGASYSQSTGSLTSPVVQSRSRGNTLRSVDIATSPSSRTSFDKAFGLIRGGRDSPVDAASRAAHILAARHAFNEKEEASLRSQETIMNKQAERDNRRLYKKEERYRRKSESLDFERTSRPSIGGRQFSDHRQAHARTLPIYVPTIHEKSEMGENRVTAKRAAQSRWLRFVAWFKTRILHISTRVTTNG